VVHFLEGDGSKVFAHACRLGLEGIVSKRRDLGYRSGRSAAWLKIRTRASEKKLAGAVMTSFIKKCERDAATSCDVSAKDKKLAGAAKNSFTKKCVLSDSCLFRHFSL